MKKLKQSQVVFDEEKHSYCLGEQKLLGITGLIHSVLGLGVYPDANEYTKDFIIPRAGSRGTAVHHAIQMYDEIGIRQDTQVVNTRYGCRERDNVFYRDETWDVGYELDSYIRHLNGFSPIANEYTVSDNDKYASQIDNVWQRDVDSSIWLVDTKTNNVGLYPTCGYYNPDYFTSGEEALKEYLSWQLSVYAEMFEAQNPDIKVEGLACNWLRKDDAAFWIIERKPSELVKELLSSEYIITDNGPVYFHPNPSIFGVQTSLPVAKETQVSIAPQDVIDYVAQLVATEKEVKAKIEDAKKGLRMAMEQHGISKYDFGSFSATIAKDSERSSFDTTRFKKEHPDLYKEYVTKKTTKGGLTLSTKFDE